MGLPQLGGLGSEAGRVAWTSWTRRVAETHLGHLKGLGELTGVPTNGTSRLDDCGCEHRRGGVVGKYKKVVLRLIYAE